MIAIHPWLRSIPVGLCIAWFTSPLGFKGAAGAALVAWILMSLEFADIQRAHEAKLLHQERELAMDMEQTFAQIQRAMANVWIGETFWQQVTANMATGYLLYRYEWREPDGPGDDGKIRHHASLEIECVDKSTDDYIGTHVTYSFDGLPNWMCKTNFYLAVETAMQAIDAFTQSPNARAN